MPTDVCESPAGRNLITDFRSFSRFVDSQISLFTGALQGCAKFFTLPWSMDFLEGVSVDSSIWLLFRVF